MKLLNLTVQGYRSLKNITWNPGNLNVLIGPNGSGKSNLLRVLELIAISSKGRLGKYIQRSGGMEPLVWDSISNLKTTLILPPPLGMILKQSNRLKRDKIIPIKL